MIKKKFRREDKRGFQKCLKGNLTFLKSIKMEVFLEDHGNYQNIDIILNFKCFKG